MATATPLTTPMLRSQTSSVLVPTWISTLGGGAATATNSATATSSSTVAASSPLPPPPPPAYGGGGGSGSNGTSNSSISRSPFFGGVGVSQGGGRAAALSAGLASWRSAGPSRISPATSPSLGPSATSPNNLPPPPPPSYSATVTTVSGTSNQSKRATIFCEIADQVYTRIVNEAAASSAPSVDATSTSTSTERDSIIAAAKASDVGKYLSVIRVAGLGDDGRDKVSSAVTVACQTQLSEPSGRFFVFELAPVGSELWPSHVSGTSTPVTENDPLSSSATAGVPVPTSATNAGKKKKGGKDREHGDEDPAHSSTSSLLPCSSHEDLWNRSRVVCVACPNDTLCSSLVAKLQEVFCASEDEKTKILIEVVKRSLPVSCCLVVKASNSANKNHEAEIVPWGEMMEAGALIPEELCWPTPSPTLTTTTMNQPAPSNLSDASNKPPPARNTPETAKPSTSPAFPSAPSPKESNSNSIIISSSSSKTLPTYEETITPLPPSNLLPSLEQHQQQQQHQHNNNDSSSASGAATEKRVPAPFPPSYFRLLRNERGVFRNALFLRFPSQAKAEIAMMYLERLNLSGRRIRIEHKKQSRSYAQQQQLQQRGGGGAATDGACDDGVSPPLGAASLSLPPPQQQQMHQRDFPPSAAAVGSSASSQCCGTNSNGNGSFCATGSPVVSHHEIMESNVHDLIRRYDRDGFSYPKRLLSAADTKFLSEVAAAHDLLFETGLTTVTVTRPRKSAAAAGAGTLSHAQHPQQLASSSSSSSNQQSAAPPHSIAGKSPALGSHTPPWAPATPPLAPRFGNGGLAAAGSLGLKDDVLNLNANQTSVTSAATSSSPNQSTASSSGGVANTSFSEKAASGTMTFRGLRHWKEQRQQLAAQEREQDVNSPPSTTTSTNASSSSSNNNNNTNNTNNNTTTRSSPTNTSSNSTSSPPGTSLESASVTQKYIRCLDWQEAQRKGIAAWSTGRGKPVVVSPIEK